MENQDKTPYAIVIDEIVDNIVENCDNTWSLLNMVDIAVDGFRFDLIEKLAGIKKFSEKA